MSREEKGMERSPDRGTRELGPFSSAVKEKKEALYDRVTLGEKQLTVIIRVASVLLGIVVILIILEAAGIFKL